MSKFTKMEIPVFLPFGQNTPADMIILVNNSLKKIQVKTTKSIKNGTMQFELCRTNGFTFEKYPYDKNDTDYFFLYCIQNDKSYFISIDEVNNRKSINLRLEDTKSNQKKGIKMAEHYDFDKMFNEYFFQKVA